MSNVLAFPAMAYSLTRYGQRDDVPLFKYAQSFATSTMRFILPSTAALLVLASGLRAQDTSAVRRFTTRNLMTAEQFHSTGLDKLSPDELRALDQWVRQYTLGMLQLQQRLSNAPSSSDAKGGVVESRIDGEFKGWEGETIFKLQNGQIWQQALFAYVYHYAFAPKVLIYESNGVYRLKVDGVDQTIQVRRLK